MPSKPYSSRTWIIWSSGLESLVDSLGWGMRGSPFACLVTNVLGDRLWPTLSSRPPGFAFFATLKRRSRALLPQGYLQNKRYTNPLLIHPFNSSYVEIKRRFCLAATCGCDARRQWLNDL